jgi:riboflavin kinase / FMN adenylyltransferase
LETFYDATPGLLEKSAIALGFFDGVHPGHQVVIGKAVEEAKKIGATATVVTFKDHPRLLTRGSSPLLLTVIEQRLELFAQLGVELTLALSFTEDLCKLTPREYVQMVLKDSLGARSISVGYNHHFGRDREGNPALLKVLGAEYGFQVHVAPMVLLDDVEVSSSRVRELVIEGDVETAGRLLTHPFAIYGEVVHGEGRGRKLGFPTANMKLYEYQCVPKRGVYAGKARLTASRIVPCVINVGYRPTFKRTEGANANGGPEDMLVEVHILDFDEDLYDQKFSVDFLKYLRPEQKFDGIEALKRQIGLDCLTAQEYVRSIDNKQAQSPEHKLLA